MTYPYIQISYTCIHITYACIQSCPRAGGARAERATDDRGAGAFLRGVDPTPYTLSPTL